MYILRNLSDDLRTNNMVFETRIQAIQWRFNNGLNPIAWVDFLEGAK
jgi:hypothetical protein